MAFLVRLIRRSPHKNICVLYASVLAIAPLLILSFSFLEKRTNKHDTTIETDLSSVYKKWEFQKSLFSMELAFPAAFTKTAVEKDCERKKKT